MNSWHSYPSIFNLGHKAIAELLLDPVLVEEKIDGSQFSFGWFHEAEESYPDGLLCRSKGAPVHTLAPDSMFKRAVDIVKELRHSDRLRPGWTYRAEYLAKPKHNVLAYDRIPACHLMIFDVNTGQEEYLDYDRKADEAARLGLEVVPRLFQGMLVEIEALRALLETVSRLGGQKVEGVVIKNYERFGLDKKVLMGKFVSEKFKEIHAKEWRGVNPNQGDIVQALIAAYRTPARWQKAVQHLVEAGELEQSPRDIGKLIAEVPADVEKECAEEIREALWKWAWPKVRRGLNAGMPEWYKERLMEKQFTDPAAEP